MNSLRDEDLRLEAKKSTLDLSPLAGEDFAQLIVNLFRADPVVVERAREALAR